MNVVLLIDTANVGQSSEHEEAGEKRQSSPQGGVRVLIRCNQQAALGWSRDCGLCGGLK